MSAYFYYYFHPNHTLTDSPMTAQNQEKPQFDQGAIIKALQNALRTTSSKIGQMNEVLDIVRVVGEAKTFKTAALALAGEIADRHHAERVSIGMVKHDYVVLAAISHTDHFEGKMQVVRDLECAMEEAYEQDASIAYPPPDGGTPLATRIHEYYSKTYGVGHMLSVPVRRGEETIAVITCERGAHPFDDEESAQIHLVATLTSARIDELYRKSGWFGKRFARAAREGFAKLLGHEHTWAKLLGILLTAFVLFAALVPIPYRVSAPAMLKTDHITYLSAPFDGFIQSVKVKPGDIVYKGDELLRLDQKELKLEEADLMAQEQDNRREIQKAQANRQLADLRIQQAKLSQTLAKLKTVRYKLSRSVVRCESDSAVVIEGDLQKRVGSHVNQGGELFQLASIEEIYMEADVSELEVNNVRLGGEGFMAIKSRPDYVYRFRTTLMNPTASVKDQENTFAVRGEFVRATPPWFRPGMTGIAKIFAGKRTLWWILSHQAIDYLRLKLWW